MSRERVLIANAAQLQLEFARKLIDDAIGNLNALVHGVGPAKSAALLARSEVTIAHQRVMEMLARVPD